MAGFEFFGAVPVRISYDNTSIAVTKVDRAKSGTLDQGVLEPREPPPLRPPLLPGGTGKREGPRGEPRRLFPAQPVGARPVVRVVGRAERVPGRRLLRRPVPPGPGQAGTKAERLADDRAAMLALPAETFEPRRVAQGHGQLALPGALRPQRLLGADRLCPPRGDVIGGIEEVAICSGTEVVAATPALLGQRAASCFDPVHYLALLERKPGAIDFARPLEELGLPGCFAVLRRRLEADLGHKGTREFIKVLRLCGERHAGRADQSGRIGHHHRGHGIRRHRLHPLHHAEQPVGLFSLDGHPHLKAVAIEPPDLTAYRALTASG